MAKVKDQAGHPSKIQAQKCKKPTNLGLKKVT